MSDSTDVFKINLTHYAFGSIDGIKSDSQFVRNEHDTTGESVVVYDKDYHSDMKFDVDEREAVTIDDLIITNKYDQTKKEMYYVIDIKNSIINKVKRHCDDVGLVCEYTELCDTIVFYIKDYSMEFDNYNDKTLTNLSDVLRYSEKMKSVIEGSIKTCFSCVRWL